MDRVIENFEHKVRSVNQDIGLGDICGAMIGMTLVHVIVFLALKLNVNKSVKNIEDEDVMDQGDVAKHSLVWWNVLINGTHRES